MDVISAFVFITFVVMFPWLCSVCLAAAAITALRSHQIKTSRWIVIPFFVIAFAFVCFFVAAGTLSYTTETKPGLLNPILVILVLEGICLLPVAFSLLIRGFVALRDAKVEAVIDLAAVSLYGLLYLPYIALHDYYPHV